MGCREQWHHAGAEPCHRHHHPTPSDAGGHGTRGYAGHLLGHCWQPAVERILHGTHQREAAHQRAVQQRLLVQRPDGRCALRRAVPFCTAHFAFLPPATPYRFVALPVPVVLHLVVRHFNQRLHGEEHDEPRNHHRQRRCLAAFWDYGHLSGTLRHGLLEPGLAAGGQLNRPRRRPLLLCEVAPCLTLHVRLYPPDILVLHEDSGHDDCQHR